MKKSVWVLSFFSSFLGAKEFDLLNNITHSGELRFGAVQLEDIDGKKSSTISLGGDVALETEPINGISSGVTFYTTNALFGKREEAMFLGSKNQSYSIVGEAYIKVELKDTKLKVGRQLFDSPFIDSDDIGMIPNTVEGYTIQNNSLADTTIILGAFDKWSGVDTPTPEHFTKMQNSGDSVLVAGVSYEGIKNTTLQAWNYKLEHNSWNYFEASYEEENFSLAGQYSNQGDGNSIYGFDGVVNLNNLSLHTAYNSVHGIVFNGFGGGPFFTSSEDHTVHETLDNKALLIGAEYSLDKLKVAFTNVHFSKIEDETDYIVSYEFNDKLRTQLIYSDMNHDGELTRFFINQSF